MPSSGYWENYKDQSASRLRQPTKDKICNALQPHPSDSPEDQDVLRNWMGFAEEMEESYSTIENWKKRTDASKAVFHYYVNEKNMSIGVLLDVMTRIKLEGHVDELKSLIEADLRDLDNPGPAQESRTITVREEPERLLGAQPYAEGSTILTDSPEVFETYDAVVSYNCALTEEEDYQLAMSVVEMLENHNYKIYMKGRDDQAGSRFNLLTTLIRNHCRKVIMVISPAYERCEECDFILQYAQSLSPGARKSKIVPILRTKESVLPEIISFVGYIDAVVDKERGWFERKLRKHLGEPMSTPRGCAGPLQSLQPPPPPPKSSGAPPSPPETPSAKSITPPPQPGDASPPLPPSNDTSAPSRLSRVGSTSSLSSQSSSSSVASSSTNAQTSSKSSSKKNGKKWNPFKRGKKE